MSVHQALATVAGLRQGRTSARESKPVPPVADAIVEATLPFLSAPVQAMVQLQRLTGCRPGEICLMRPCDVEMSAEVWCYRPAAHKTEHRGHERRIYLGPRAQNVLTPWLKRPSSDYCFSPAEAEAQRRSARQVARKTPLHYGNRPGSNRKAKPRRPPGKQYSPDSYRRAIARACRLAKVPVWCPNQLRHTRATELRRLHGLDAAQVVLGHSEAFVTQIYAEQDFSKAEELMRLHG